MTRSIRSIFVFPLFFPLFFTLLRCLAISSFTVFFVPHAFAKNVKIEWSPIEGAIRYEIKIKNDSKLSLKKVTEQPLWKGDLDPGVYFYQIRGIDRAHRAGSWTEFKNLAVMPPSPKQNFPPDGAHLDLYDQKVKTVLKWDLVPGVNQYTIELKKNGVVFSRTPVEGNRLELSGLEAGKYAWSVMPVLTLDGRSPAFLAGKESEKPKQKRWEAKPSEENEFKVEYKRLEAPRLVEPRGPIAPSDEGRITLSWKAAEGAQAYEVQLLKTNKNIQDRTLASDLAKTKRFITEGHSMTSSVSQEGTYVWGVRALANLDENRVPQAIGPESVTQFDLDRNSIYKGDLGYIAFSTMFSPFTYSVVSPSKNFQTSSGVQSTATVFRFSGEYWFSRQWAVAGAVSLSTIEMNQQNFSMKSYELGLKYRAKLSSGKFGWSVSPKLGLELREYLELLPNSVTSSGSLQSINILMAGAAAGLDVRRQFTESLGLGIKLGYFFPLSILGGPAAGSSFGSGVSYRNLSVGAQGLYWLSSNWGLGAGGYFELKSVGYQVPGSSQFDQVSMDAAYFFGSVIYRFWK